MSQYEVVPGRPNRTALAGLLSLLFILLGTGTAAADAAAPTNYKSTVFDVDPAVAGVTFTVVGGDAFMEVEVAEGHSVLVPGYFKEPYIRIDTDGSVWLNLDSPAYYINQDRYGNVQAPPEADGKGEPRWENVGSGGTYAWQDHRVHWMSFDLPPTVARDRYQVVFPWEFPVVIDGQEANVRGELVWVPSRNPYWPLLAGALGLLPLVFWDRMKVPVAAAVVGLATGVAVVIAFIQYGGTPASAGGFPLSAGLLLVTAGAAIAGLVSYNERRRLALAALLAGGLALLGWALLNVGTLWLPVLPSATISNMQRAGVALVLWAGSAVALAMGIKLVRSR
jgi:hypothetical protein